MTLNWRITAVFLSIALFLPAANGQTDDSYIETDHLEISISLGGGVLTNPVANKSSIPLVILPSIKYYRQNVFFDNGIVGYTFNPTQNFQISAIAKPNFENLFFVESSAIASVLVGFRGLSEAQLESLQADEYLFEDDFAIRDRKWAFDAGFQANWFVDEKLHLTLNYVHDVTNVYKGSNGLARMDYVLLKEPKSKLLLTISSGFEWKSANLINYYYGIDERDDVPDFFHYQTSSAFTPFFSLKVKQQFTENWRLLGLFKKEFLGNNISDSPIIVDDTIETFFVGLEYAF